MNDPYKTLGVSPDASDEDIKKAYRALARKYHPDKYRDSDLAELASEKMKEINAAYEEIKARRANGGGGRADRGRGSGAYEYAGGTSSNPTYAEVRRYINTGNIGEAERILNGIPTSDRNGEWHFLFGYTQMRLGRYVDAQRYFDIACSMDPYNREYRTAQEALRRRAGAYGGGEDDSSDDLGCLCAQLACCSCCIRCCCPN